MQLTPRKPEVEEVVALLESSDFESAQDLAKAIIKAVANQFERREWYAMAWRDKADGTGLSLAWGPITSEVQVNTLAKKMAVGGIVRPVKLNSVGDFLDNLLAQEKGKSKTCGWCGHPNGTHLHERQMGNCQVRGCKCRKLTDENSGGSV